MSRHRHGVAPTVALAVLITAVAAVVHGNASSNDVARAATPGGAVIRVKIFLPRGAAGTECDRVLPVSRLVRPPAVLTGSMRALLAGPTASERQRGYGGWFAAKTSGKLRSVRISRAVAFVDFHDFRRIVPGASSSCGSALLLAQLNRTATQFPTVRRAVYSFDGNRRVFYEWLQLSAPR